MTLRQIALLVSALTVSLLSMSAQATNLVVNGSFEQTTLNTSGKVTSTDLPGWTTTSGYTFVVFPGTASTNINGGGGTVAFYVGANAPAQSPNNSSADGGNYLAADGAYETGTLSQTLTGLTVGANYNLTFYQAGAQQTGYSGATTDQWQVGFGAQTQLSTLINNPSQQFSNWTLQSMTFQATAATQVLSFLAVGTPQGVPPFSLLDGVSVTQVPEPASWGLMMVGLIGILLVRRRYLNRA